MRQRAALSTFASAQTGTVLAYAAPLRSLVVAGAVITAADANTATPAVTIKLGSTPVFSHPGVPAGGGMVIAGFNIIGEPGESVVVDCGNPGGMIAVMVAYE